MHSHVAASPTGNSKLNGNPATHRPTGGASCHFECVPDRIVDPDAAPAGPRRRNAATHPCWIAGTRCESRWEGHDGRRPIAPARPDRKNRIATPVGGTAAGLRDDRCETCKSLCPAAHQTHSDTERANRPANTDRFSESRPHRGRHAQPRRGAVLMRGAAAAPSRAGRRLCGSPARHRRHARARSCARP